jgi:hypothetical protein
MRPRVAAAVAALGLVALAAVRAPAQSSARERIGFEEPRPNSIEASMAVSLSAAGRGWTAAPGFSLEYSRDRAFSFALSMPAAVEYAGSSSKDPWSFSWGDPAAQLSYLWHLGNSRLLASLGYAYPLEREHGRGHALSPMLSWSALRDPVVIGLSLDGRISSPRTDGGYRLWRPFSGGIGLSYWELLNDRVSFHLRLSPRLDFGEMRLGSRDMPRPLCSIALSAGFAWDDRAWGLRAGWDGTAGSSASGDLSLAGALRKEW